MTKFPDMTQTYKPASQTKVVSFMAALSVQIKDMRLAEMCLVELLALAAEVPLDDQRVWS